MSSAKLYAILSRGDELNKALSQPMMTQFISTYMHQWSVESKELIAAQPKTAVAQDNRQCYISRVLAIRPKLAQYGLIVAWSLQMY